jgi:hypothetical protein
MIMSLPDLDLLRAALSSAVELSEVRAGLLFNTDLVEIAEGFLLVVVDFLTVEDILGGLFGSSTI